MDAFGRLTPAHEDSHRRPLMLWRGRWKQPRIVAVRIHFDPNRESRQLERFCGLRRANGHDMSGTKLLILQPEFRLGDAVEMSGWDVEAKVGPCQLRLPYSGPGIRTRCLANTKNARFAGRDSGAQHGLWPGVYQVWTQSRHQPGGS